MVNTTFSLISDEALILLIRYDLEPMARDVLAIRYFKRRVFFARTLSEEATRIMDSWTLNEVFFRSYMRAESSFEFGKGSFRSLLTSIYKRELNKEFAKIISERIMFPTVSLDEELPDGGTLHDLLSEMPVYYNEGGSFVNFLDLVEALKGIKGYLSKYCVPMVLLLANGYRITELSKVLEISPSYIRKMLAQVKRYFIEKNERVGLSEEESLASSVISSVDDDESED